MPVAADTSRNSWYCTLASGDDEPDTNTKLAALAGAADTAGGLDHSVSVGGEARTTHCAVHGVGSATPPAVTARASTEWVPSARPDSANTPLPVSYPGSDVAFNHDAARSSRTCTATLALGGVPVPEEDTISSRTIAVVALVMAGVSSTTRVSGVCGELPVSVPALPPLLPLPPPTSTSARPSSAYEKRHPGLVQPSTNSGDASDDSAALGPSTAAGHTVTGVMESTVHVSVTGGPMLPAVSTDHSTSVTVAPFCDVTVTLADVVDVAVTIALAPPVVTLACTAQPNSDSLLTAPQVTHRRSVTVSRTVAFQPLHVRLVSGGVASMDSSDGAVTSPVHTSVPASG